MGATDYIALEDGHLRNHIPGWDDKSERNYPPSGQSCAPRDIKAPILLGYTNRGSEGAPGHKQEVIGRLVRGQHNGEVLPDAPG